MNDLLADWSLKYLKAAEKLYDLNQRFVGFWVPAYYLLHQSMELAIKYVIVFNKKPITRSHNLISLINNNKRLFKLSKDDYEIISKLEALNKGHGGLRYPQDEQVEGFLPSTFDKSVKIIQNLILKK